MYTGVDMRLSKKYEVPLQLALLYEFTNSLDLRRYVEQGTAHAGSDEFATASMLEEWMRARGLLAPRARINTKEHHRVLKLRDALRSFLRLAPDQRTDAAVTVSLNNNSADFPLVLNVSSDAQASLLAAPGSSQIGRVLGELYSLTVTGRLDRLKVCASEECRWIFYDRSKPSNRRWCSSKLCGNRDKTRAYRRRLRGDEASP
jgi:predicted RNA-binding Zn ribbon-like protein